jgi:hypothetical protein
MSTYTIVPNQPLGWSATIPTDECGCDKHEYCAPLLFEFSNAVYEAYTARAVADGALASDIPEACMEEIMDTFYELSRAVRYLSDPISILYQGDPSQEEECSNMPFILDYAPGAPIEGDWTSYITSEDSGYIEGQASWLVEAGESEVTEQNIFLQFESPFTGGCPNTVCFSVEPDDKVDLGPWQITVGNGNGTFEINSVPGNPAAPFSICFEMDLYDPAVGVININMPLNEAGEVFQGIFRIASATENCNFSPVGLVESEDGEVIGSLYEQTIGTVLIDGGESVAFFTTATIGVNTIEEIKNKCLYIKVGSECCCPDVFYSKCIKPIFDACHTVSIDFWQNVTVNDESYGFGFYYPAAAPGTEFKQFMRVWGEVRNPQYDGEMEMYQDSFGRKKVVYAESREFRSFIINYSPEYIHNALRLACRHDNFALTDTNYGLNAVNFFTRSEAYSPSWIRISKLAPVTLEVEKQDQNLVGGGAKTFCY